MSKRVGFGWVIVAAVGVASACGEPTRSFDPAQDPAVGGEAGEARAGTPAVGGGGTTSGGTSGGGTSGGGTSGGGASGGGSDPAGATGGTGMSEGGTPPEAGSGAGEPPAEVICAPDTNVCDGNRAVTCNAEGTAYVGAGVQCSSKQTCVAGACEAHECEPSARFCSGKTVRECSPDGLSSEEVAACDTGQYCDPETAACKAGVCAPDWPACDGNRATVCNASGSGYQAGGVVCTSAQTCEKGACQPHVCKPNQKFCQGQTVKTCAANGLSSAVESTCTNQACVATGDTASCTGACAPGQTRCASNGVQTCSDKGQYGTASACTNKTCIVTGSVASCSGVCAPQQKQCSGNGVRSCEATGQFGSVVACTNQACVATGDTASCTGECAPGQTRCASNGVQTCNDKGQYGTASACTNKTCVVTGSVASCSGVCAPQQKQCSGNGVRSCDATGQFGSVVACAASTPTCSGAGVCGSPRSCSGLANNCGSSGTANCCASTVLPAGTFNRSNDASYPATVSSFRLDDYEVTVSRFRKFIAAYSQSIITAGAGKNPNDANDDGWSSAWNASMPATTTALKDAIKNCSNWEASNWTDAVGSSSTENRPMNCISWFEAQAFCVWDGGRLPTEAEWNYAAAGGSLQRKYAWGNNAPGANASLAVLGCYYNGTGDCADGANHYAPVGSVPAGNARWGQSDMTGNVTEWVLDWYASDYPSTSCKDCANHSGDFYRVRRGGAAIDPDGPPMTTIHRQSTGPENHYPDTGVRCVRAP